MSTRYGISVTLDSAFTAGLHRARQVVCSQYGCWAAEMHSVHLPLTDYFPCPEQELSSLGAALEKVVEEFRDEQADALLVRRGTVAEPEAKGSVYLEFSEEGDGSSERQVVSLLRAEVAEALSRMNLMVGAEALPLRFALLQYSGLPDPVFRSAARFADGVVNGLQMPTSVALSELALFRYESAAAGEEWDDGAWASDLTWRIVNVYPLTGADSR